jgi:hypothetical protein
VAKAQQLGVKLRFEIPLRRVPLQTAVRMI